MSVSVACARTLVDEFARAGLRVAVLAPGSRSAPMAMALADDERIDLHVLLDERSAAFFALGAAKASGQPALVLCTSGTAAAHFHPAVLEADHSQVPLIVCTADRPAELRDTGAPQTTDQVHLYGSAVRCFADIPADGDPAARSAWRPIAARVWGEAAGPPAGPVHLNVAFREPLVDVGGQVGAEPGRADGRPRVLSHRAEPAALPAADAADLVLRIAAARRGLVVAGWGSPVEAAQTAAVLRWPLLADGISGQRHSDGAVTTYEALLRVPGFAEQHRPDLVIRFGGPLTSKAATVWLDAGVPQILVDPAGAWLDPGRAAAERIPSLPNLAGIVASDAPGDGPVDDWYEAWIAAENLARRALDALLDADEQPFEGRVARDVAAVCAASGRRPALVVASSMPVRDLEAFAGQVPVEVYANRGVNGIDGLVSTVLGVAAGSADASAEPSRRPAVGLLGDLAFLHDAGGLLGATARGLDAVFVVVDNGGGGIFSFLPQAALPSERFELLFGTPPGADIAEVAKAYGIAAEQVGQAKDVGPALERALTAGGVQVLVVPTGDRTANVDRHRQAWAAVAEAFTKSA
jgi:2-succinyl-5-enolpyruvyl-6-hydroxy-3-cyclohexene-1-carboxylate synthase